MANPTLQTHFFWRTTMAAIPLNMKTTITTTSIGLGAVGIFGAFAAHSDLLAIAPAWTGMFLRLANQAGKPMERDRVLKVVTGVLVGVTSFVGGVKLANSYFAYTGIGTIPAIVVNAGVNGTLTWLAGRAWAQICLEDDLEQSVDNLIASLIGAIAASLPGR
jgi:uncharacterized protein (DUF697 family)